MLLRSSPEAVSTVLYAVEGTMSASADDMLVLNKVPLAGITHKSLPR